MSGPSRLLRALRSAVQEQCDQDVAVLFSGGLDSSVIAFLAAEVCSPRLYTAGMPGSHDLVVAEAAARELGLEWVPMELDRESIVSSLPRLSSLLATDSPLVLSFEMPLFAIAPLARERVLVSGQGADELFGGYARYARMEPDQLRASLDRDQRELLATGAPRERLLASRFGKELRHPYLHGAVLEVARDLAPSQLVSQGERKRALRQAAAVLGLEDAASRPKKAAQYGSGIMREMRAEARRRGVPLSQLVPSLAEGETL